MSIDALLGDRVDRCPFIEGGTMSIGWQGNVSPCLSLLHEDESHLGNRRRRGGQTKRPSLTCVLPGRRCFIEGITSTVRS